MKFSDRKKQGRLLDPNTIQFERVLPGPIELVWDYLTRQEYLATWLVDSPIDAQVGGQLTLSQNSDRVPIRSPDEIRGVITQCIPPRLLAYTWQIVPKESTAKYDPNVKQQSEVIFELQAREEQVHLTLTHRKVPANYIPQTGAGWHTHLEFLSEATRGKAKPAHFFSDYERVLPMYVRACLKLNESNPAHPEPDCDADDAKSERT